MKEIRHARGAGRCVRARRGLPKLRPRRLPARHGRRSRRTADRPDPRARAATRSSRTPRATRSTPTTVSRTRRRCRRASSRAAPVSRARSRRSRRRSCCSSSRTSPSSAASFRRRFSTSRPCGSKKVAAMEAMGAQGYLRQYYSERAEHRANHARRISGRSRHPLRGGVPARDPRRGRRAVTDYAALARLGVATVHEAAGRTGIVDLPLTQVVPGSRVAGPAQIALCAARRQHDGARGDRARARRATSSC